jgi:hypothetical protein
MLADGVIEGRRRGPTDTVAAENFECDTGTCSHQRWASASRKLTLVSAFRHQSSQSITGPKNAELKRFYSGTGLVATSLVFFSPVPDWPDADQSGIPAVSDCKTVLFAAFFSRSSTKLPTIEPTVP